MSLHADTAHKRSALLVGVLDTMPIGAWQIVLVVTLLAAIILDGYDVKLLSYAAPLILAEWNLTQSAFAPALAAAVVGMAIGASTGGWIGDRRGRKEVLVCSVILFGTTTVASGFAPDATWMTILRFIGGLGFGGVVPNAYALVAEWLPRRLQSRVIALMSVGSPLGGMVGAGVTLFLLPNYGWRGCFVIAGATTALLGLFMLLWLPESPTFSLLKGRTERVSRDWRKIMGKRELKLDLAGIAIPTDQEPERVRKTIFERQFLRLNIGVMLVAFFSPFAIYVFGSWMPVILTTAGLHINEAIQGSFALNLCAVLCGLASGELVRHFGSRTAYVFWAVMMLISLAGIAFLVTSGQAATGGSGKTLLMAALGGYGGGGGGLISVLASNLTAAYPPDRRATGIGYGSTWGRIGMIAAAMAGGNLLTSKTQDPTPVFIVAGGALLIVMISAFVINRHLIGSRGLTGSPAGRAIDGYVAAN